MFGVPIIPFDLRRYFCFIIKLFQNLWHHPCLYPLNLTSTLNTGRCLGSNTSSAFHSRSIWTQSQTFTEYRQYLYAIPCDFFSVLSFSINVEYHWRKRIDILKDGLLPPLFILALPQNKLSIRGSAIEPIWNFLYVQPIFIDEKVLEAMSQNFKALTWL